MKLLQQQTRSKCQDKQPGSRRTRSTYTVHASAITQQVQTSKSQKTFQDLPASVRNATAVLEVNNPASATGTTTVYLMGMSHVSKRSAEDVAALIRSVAPEVVMLELCKDRVGLLVDPDAPPPQIWHTRQVRFNGLPEGDGYPSQQALIATLATQPGSPITVGDIESDCTALLATGIFGSIRPQVKAASITDAPAFLVDTGRVRAVAPFSIIEFVVTERKLPPIESVSMRLESTVESMQLRGLLDKLPQQALVRARPPQAAGEAAELASSSAEKQSHADGTAREQGAASAEEAGKEAADKLQDDAADKDAEASEGAAGAPSQAPGTVSILMWLRAQVLAACEQAGLQGDNISVVFKGAESGRVEVFVKAGAPTLTGLEGSAVDGQGSGIEPFKPSRQMFALTSANMKVDISPWVNQALKGATGAKGPAENSNAGLSVRPSWRAWDTETILADENSELDKKLEWQHQVAELSSRLLTGSYARSQAAAGRKCGIEVPDA